MARTVSQHAKQNNKYTYHFLEQLTGDVENGNLPYEQGNTPYDKTHL